MMNDQYLWNKTGEDAEIKTLENALRAFRYKETAAPALPAKILSLDEKRPRKFLSFSFAFATMAFAALALSFVWFQMPGNKPSDRDRSRSIVTAQEDSGMDKLKMLPIGNFKAPLPIAKTKTIKIREIRREKLRPIQTVVKQSNPPVKLTRDEEYAYDQLMLALSITSSKLKIVKDKLDGIDEQNALVDTQR